jgi:hypothetical protein
MAAPRAVWTTARKAVRERRFVTPEALNVAPALVGWPLAMPWRRSQAMGVDLLAVALISNASDLWLFIGLALVVWQLRRQRAAQRADAADGQAQALPSMPEQTGQALLPAANAIDPRWRGKLLAAVLLALAAQQLWHIGSGWSERESARERQRAETVELALPLELPAAAPAASEPVARIAQLEAEAAALREAAVVHAQAQVEHAREQLRRARPPSVREQLQSLAEAVASSLGWGIVYFSLLPAWWGGQTLGKRLLGLRVVELTGQPMTVLRCLKRYGGYAAGMATGGLGFAQTLWDPNRQGLQDKAAHTVVVDLRAAALPRPETEPRTAR